MPDKAPVNKDQPSQNQKQTEHLVWLKNLSEERCAEQNSNWRLNDRNKHGVRRAGIGENLEIQNISQ